MCYDPAQNNTPPDIQDSGVLFDDGTDFDDDTTFDAAFIDIRGVTAVTTRVVTVTSNPANSYTQLLKKGTKVTKKPTKVTKKGTKVFTTLMGPFR